MIFEFPSASALFDDELLMDEADEDVQMAFIDAELLALTGVVLEGKPEPQPRSYHLLWKWQMVPTAMISYWRWLEWSLNEGPNLNRFAIVTVSGDREARTSDFAATRTRDVDLPPQPPHSPSSRLSLPSPIVELIPERASMPIPMARSVHVM